MGGRTRSQKVPLLFCSRIYNNEYRNNVEVAKNPLSKRSSQKLGKISKISISSIIYEQSEQQHSSQTPKLTNNKSANITQNTHNVSLHSHSIDPSSFKVIKRIKMSLKVLPKALTKADKLWHSCFGHAQHSSLIIWPKYNGAPSHRKLSILNRIEAQMKILKTMKQKESMKSFK